MLDNKDMRITVEILRQLALRSKDRAAMLLVPDGAGSFLTVAIVGSSSAQDAHTAGVHLAEGIQEFKYAQQVNSLLSPNQERDVAWWAKEADC